MVGILMSIAAIYLAMAALGAVIVGTHAYLPLSVLGLPAAWVGPAILAVTLVTVAVAGSLFWLSDQVVYRLIGSPDRRRSSTAARPQRCYLCGADLLRDARTCAACGVLIPDRPGHAPARQSDPALRAASGPQAVRPQTHDTVHPG